MGVQLFTHLMNFYGIPTVCWVLGYSMERLVGKPSASAEQPRRLGRRSVSAASTRCPSTEPGPHWGAGRVADGSWRQGCTRLLRAAVLVQRGRSEIVATLLDAPGCPRGVKGRQETGDQGSVLSLLITSSFLPNSRLAHLFCILL